MHLRIISCIVGLLSAVLAAGQTVGAAETASDDAVCDTMAIGESDSVVYETDPCADPAHPEWGRDYYCKNWVQQLFANGFRINDPGINYPKFMRF